MATLSRHNIHHAIACLVLLFVAPTHAFQCDLEAENVAKEYMGQLNANASILAQQATSSQWNFETNITDFNEKAASVTSELSDEFERSHHNLTTSIKTDEFCDSKLKRMIERQDTLGVAALGSEKSGKFSDIVTEMQTIYSTATVCIRGVCGLALDPNLTSIMAESRDWDMLSETWVTWRNATGRMRELYMDYVDLGGEAAEKNGLDDYSQVWLAEWEDKKMKSRLASLWKEVRPLYQKLHAFVRLKLGNFYVNQRLPDDGTIPAHILGNMWAQSWQSIDDIVTPFPEKGTFDVTEDLKREGYTPVRMFKLAESFFVSLGLQPMTDKFWTHSMMERPNNRNVVCHASAWDFHSGDDFRIKMCTEVDMESFLTIHHEMGHIQYFMLYRKQPFLFRDGANPGFHEAIGDTISLSVAAPSHLKRIGLLTKVDNDTESMVNHQLRMALDAVAFLPFSYIIDLWRWDVFAGKTSEKQLNRKWWELRLKYQGISPPVNRSEQDFDPACKSHVADDTPYISYFMATLLRFQFHEALCKVAGQSIELFKCDIYGNKAVGQKLQEVLAQGSSVPWPLQLKQLTGSDFVSAKPMLKYFQPLTKFLDEELLRHGLMAKVGWKSASVDKYFRTKRNVQTDNVGQNSDQHDQQQQVNF